jgi:hypothetical protein
MGSNVPPGAGQAKRTGNSQLVAPASVDDLGSGVTAGGSRRSTIIDRAWLMLGLGAYSGCCCHLTRSNSLPSGSANVVCDTLNVTPPARTAGSLIWLSGLAPRPVSRSISSS